jgi:hypothetical protein
MAILAQAQVLPNRPTLGNATVGQFSLAPMLRAPADGAVIASPSSAPTVRFEWAPAPNSPRPEYFELTLADARDPRSRGLTVIRVAPQPDAIAFSAPIPTPFAGQRVTWSVRACGGVTATAPSPIGAPPPVACGPSASRTLVWNIDLEAPTLRAPAPGFAVLPNTVFAWSSVPQATRYLLCLSEPGIACPLQPGRTGGSLVLETAAPVTQARFADAIARWTGSTFNWTVASCGALSQCRYQSADRSASVVVPPPTLVEPAEGATVTRRSTFRWAPSPLAQFYVLCVSEPGVGCPTAINELPPYSPNGWPPERPLRPTAAVSTSRTYAYSIPATESAADISLDPIEGTRHWTVGACYRPAVRPGATAPNFRCDYQSTVRTIQLPKKLWQVSVSVDAIDVFETGDNVSPGDWKVSLFTIAQGQMNRQAWPAGQRTTRDVDRPSTIQPTGLSTNLYRLRSDLPAVAPLANTVLVGVSVLDCDRDGLASVIKPLITPDVSSFIDLVRDWSHECGGEEIFEVSGADDVLGAATTLVDLRDIQGDTFRLNRAIDARGNDARSPFRVHVTITGRRE